jgi:hypothetical protein
MITCVNGFWGLARIDGVSDEGLTDGALKVRERNKHEFNLLNPSGNFTYHQV